MEMYDLIVLSVCELPAYLLSLQERNTFLRHHKSTTSGTPIRPYVRFRHTSLGADRLGVTNRDYERLSQLAAHRGPRLTSNDFPVSLLGARRVSWHGLVPLRTLVPLFEHILC